MGKRGKTAIPLAPVSLATGPSGAGDVVSLVIVHMALSSSMPALHDFCPDKVYPVLQVGVHNDPLSRKSPQGDINPFAIVPVGHLRVFVGL